MNIVEKNRRLLVTAENESFKFYRCSHLFLLRLFLLTALISSQHLVYSTPSDDLLKVQPSVGIIPFDPKNFSLVNTTTNYIMDGDFQQNKIPNNNINQSFQNSTYWIPNVCEASNQAILVNAANYSSSMLNNGQALFLVSNQYDSPGEIRQIVNILNAGVYYLLLEFAVNNTSPPQKKQFSIYINNIRVVQVEPSTFQKFYLVVRVYLLPGPNSIKFTVKSYLGDGVLIDNVKLYSQNIAQAPQQQYQTIRALQGGFPFTFSTILATLANKGSPLLDSSNTWCASSKKAGQFIEISATYNVIWKNILTQGKFLESNVNCLTCCSWVKSYTISYTQDGFNWYSYASGKIFTANTDNTQIVKNSINLSALAIRIYPVQWKGSMCMRIDAQFDRAI